MSNGTYYCHLCNERVNDTTKHCGKCNKCVSGFDHHCIWLNNCIGEQNFKNFIVLLILHICLSVTQIASLIVFALT